MGRKPPSRTVGTATDSVSRWAETHDDTRKRVKAAHAANAANAAAQAAERAAEKAMTAAVIAGGVQTPSSPRNSSPLARVGGPARTTGTQSKVITPSSSGTFARAAPRRHYSVASLPPSATEPATTPRPASAPPPASPRSAGSTTPRSAMKSPRRDSSSGPASAERPKSTGKASSG